MRNRGYGEKARRLVALVGLCLCVSPLHAAQTTIPDAPAQWVTDTADFISPATASALNARLEAYERSTGHQLIVYIGQTTGDVPIEDWAAQAFEKWRLGRKGIDNGLALFIMSADRRLRFEVGYGLEAVVPDVIAGRVINDVITPRIRAGDPDGAVTAGMDAVMTVIGGGGLPASSPGTDRGQRPLTVGQLIVYAIVGIVILFIFATNPTLALYLLASILSSGGHRRGGWGGGGRGGGWGGGGFRGGGGRTGGGGATGSW